MASTEGSIKQAADLAIKAHAAAQVWAEATQADVDRVTQAMAEAGHEAAEHLAEMAHAETGYGRVDHKTFKNIFCTRRYLDADPPHPDGRRDRELPGARRHRDRRARRRRGRARARSRTRPSTTLFYGIACVRARNAVVNAAHPRAVQDDRRDGAHAATRRATGAGAPPNLITAMTEVSIEGTAGADGALPHRPRTGHRLAADGARRVLVRQADVRGRARQLAVVGAPVRAPTWARRRPASWPRRRSTTAPPARRSRP